MVGLEKIPENPKPNRKSLKLKSKNPKPKPSEIQESHPKKYRNFLYGIGFQIPFVW